MYLSRDIQELETPYSRQVMEGFPNQERKVIQIAVRRGLCMHTDE